MTKIHLMLDILIILVDFFVSDAAGVVGYYVCKWLDRHGKGR